MRITCFKHVPFEGPAAVADWAFARGHVLNCIELFAGQKIPGANSSDMLLVMGGPMNVYQESEYPWLAAEKHAIRSAIKSGKVVVGIPLGASRIASSAACRNQGFLYQERVLALQCHLETTRESMNALIEACGHEIQSGAYIQNADAMQAEPDATFDTIQRVLFELLDHVTCDASSASE